MGGYDYVLKEGEAYKQGQDFVGRYKRRWLTLYARRISYSIEDTGKEKGIIPLSDNTSVGATEEKAGQYRWEVRPGVATERVFRLACETANETEAWVRAIAEECGVKRFDGGIVREQQPVVIADILNEEERERNERKAKKKKKKKKNTSAPIDDDDEPPPPPPPDSDEDDAPPPPCPETDDASASPPSAGRQLRVSPSGQLKGKKNPKKKGALGIVRGLVSKKKRRFQQDGFDLDLSYINPKIIAMGYPSSGLEAQYRNRMDDTQRFFTKYHDGSSKIYNLCSERAYPPTSFPDCCRFGFDDHNPPPFKLLYEVCKDMLHFYKKSEESVVAIHCKAGKGRTGCVISAFLLACDEADTAEASMNMFGEARTRNNKGVTIPSQQRYVRYYERFERELRRTAFMRFTYPTVHLRLITLVHPPNFDSGGGCDPYFKIFSANGDKVYNMLKDKQQKVTPWRKESKRHFDVDIALTGDFKVVFYDQDKLSKPDKMFTFWLNTGFLRSNKYVFPKDTLDGAIKDKTHKIFAKEFRMELTFEQVPGAALNCEPEVDENNTPFYPKPVQTNQANDPLEEDSEDDEVPRTREKRTQMSKLNGIRGLVSKKKHRFQDGKFDLDLSYITPQLIAMGYPSEGLEAAYRNKMSDTQSFFNAYHPSKVRVYNLCSERQYKKEMFFSCVQFPFDDHNPPPFKTLVDVCSDIYEHVTKSKVNIAAVHCKAGKGRTGTVLAAYLIRSGEAQDAEEALNWFGTKRTRNNKGVTIPSQQRYVRYFDRYVQEYVKPDRLFNYRYPTVQITKITLSHPPNFDVGGGCDPYLKITMGGKTAYNMKKDKDRKVTAWRKDVPWTFEGSITVQGDFKIVFYDKDTIGADDKMFSLWLNSFFVRPSLRFTKQNLDSAVKDKKHKLFHEDFTCELEFEGAADVPGMGPDDDDENTAIFTPTKIIKGVAAAEGLSDTSESDR